MYSAAGNKLRKILVAGGNTITTEYENGIEYDNSTNTIAFIQTEEGRARKSGSSYVYEYDLKDHLGNTRVTLTPDPNDATQQTAKLLQMNDYYAFGYGIQSTQQTISPKNEYLYNHKELQEETGLYDYGARFYDPVTGRWNSVDPLAEKMRRFSPYNYGDDNAIRKIDPDGMETQSCCGVLINPTAMAKAGSDFGKSIIKGTVDLVGAILTAVVDDNNTGGHLKVGSKEWKELQKKGVEDTKTAVVGVTVALATDFVAGKLFGALEPKVAGIVTDWTAHTSDPLVGDLANTIDSSLGSGTVQGVGVPFNSPIGIGDTDIALADFNIEVKSGNKMKLSQSLKNAAQAESEGKGYFLYMPNATSAQIKEAARQGITVLKDQTQLLKNLAN